MYVLYVYIGVSYNAAAEIAVKMYIIFLRKKKCVKPRYVCRRIKDPQWTGDWMGTGRMLRNLWKTGFKDVGMPKPSSGGDGGGGGGTMEERKCSGTFYKVA